MAAVAERFDGIDMPLSSEEFRVMQAKLMATITRADGKILQVENLLAESMIELMDPNELLMLQTLYEECLRTPLTHHEVNEIVAFIERAPREERLSLVDMVISLAACDGEIHRREEDIIHRILGALKLTDENATISRACAS